MPINQEDMAVTLLAFSFNVLHGIELTLNKPLSATDQSDYLHLWRYIGWLMGVEDDRNPCAGTVRINNQFNDPKICSSTPSSVYSREGSSATSFCADMFANSMLMILLLPLSIQQASRVLC